MQINFQTYIRKDSPIHRLDACMKVVLLLAYSVTLFLFESYTGLFCAALLFAVTLFASRIPARRVLGLVKPVYVLAAFVVLCNSFILTVDPVSLRFTLDGFERGMFFAIRVLLLVYASILLSFTTPATELTNAAARFLAPLRKAGVSTDDAVVVFSIALRFIPVTIEEFCRVRDAQRSRGKEFESGSLVERLKAWVSVLTPMIVGMFRRADFLALAMDARCFGAAEERGSLDEAKIKPGQLVIACVGVALYAAFAWFF